MKYYILGILIFMVNFVFSQSQPSEEDRKFDVFGAQVVVNKKGFAADRIIEIGDSLYNVAASDRQKIRSIFVLIYGYTLKKEKTKALSLSMKIDSIAKKSNTPILKVKAAFSLSEQYRELGLYDKSSEKAKEGLKIAQSLPEMQENEQKVFAYLQLGKISYAEEKYKQSLEYCNQSIQTIEQLRKQNSKENLDYFLIACHFVMGDTYTNLKNYIEAEKSYKNALNIIEATNYNKNNTLSASIYISYALVMVKTGQYKEAYEYINKAKKMSADTNYGILEDDIQSVLTEYYSAIKDFKSSDSLKTLMIKKKQKDFSVSSTIAQNIIKKEELSVNKNQQKSKILYYIIIGTILCSILIIYIVYEKKNRQEKKFQQVIADLTKKQELVYIESELIPQKNNDKIISKIPFISPETEKALLQKIIEFENGNLYTQKNFTSSNMATLFGTNIRYVAYLLQKYRDKNFNDYINHLRIRFISQKLLDDPKYRTYKINYLSEYCGYSSHSRFAQIFKKETGMSPSDFISQISSKPV